MTRRAADWLGRLGGCRPLAILSDDFDDVVWNCEAERADLLVLEMDFSNGVEDKDVSGRCDIAAEVRKRRPECRVYLICEDGYPKKQAALDKAVELMPTTMRALCPPRWSFLLTAQRSTPSP